MVNCFLMPGKYDTKAMLLICRPVNNSLGRGSLKYFRQNYYKYEYFGKIKCYVFKSGVTFN